MTDYETGRDWFGWYCEQAAKTKDFAMFNEKYVCPCCYMPTLSERADYEICPICFWEDDGQDSDDASITRGGPNGGYSLMKARSNFIEHFTMYDMSTPDDFEREKRKEPNRRSLYASFTRAIATGTPSDWKQAKTDLESYYSRGGLG